MPEAPDARAADPVLSGTTADGRGHTLQDGYVTNRLTLDGPELPGTAEG